MRAPEPQNPQPGQPTPSWSLSTEETLRNKGLCASGRPGAQLVPELHLGPW